MTTANRLEGIGEYYFSTKLREIEEMNKAGKSVINLGIGSPDLPPHPTVIAALQEAAAKPQNHAYQSYKGTPVLRNAIAGWYQLWYGVALDPQREILPLIGSKEGIMHVCMTYINSNTLVLIPNPGYPTYRAAAQLAGGLVQDYLLTAENNWHPDLEAIQSSIMRHRELAGTEASVLMFLNYPHMPTGQQPDLEKLEKLVQLAKQERILLVHDNPYSFILNDKPFSLLSLPGAMEVAVELNSLSKSHNMAGWRIGMLVGAQQHIDNVLRFKSNMDSGMFLPLQLAAATALQLGKDWHDGLNDIYRKRRTIAFQILEELGCTHQPNQIGMFVWAAIPGYYDNAYTLSDEVLHRSHVFITPGGIFGSAGDRFLRISLCSNEERLGEALKRIQST